MNTREKQNTKDITFYNWTRTQLLAKFGIRKKAKCHLLEEWIKERPSDWLWLHRRWKS